MQLCPSCKASRWVYPRWIPFAELLDALTGLGRFECVACGWRGWRRSRATAAPLPVVQQLRSVTQFVREIVAEHVARGFRLLPFKRPATLRTAATWLMPAFALGLVVGVRLSSRGERVASVNTIPVAEQAPSLEPAAHTAGPFSEARPPDRPAVAGPRADTPLVAYPPGVPAKAQQPTQRADVATRPAAPAADVVPPPTDQGAPAAPSGSGQWPGYRGSLAIDSDPPGGRVSVDGRVVGATPIVLKDVPAGSHVVRVESNGYAPWSAAARVVADQQTRVIATLQRRSRP
jgi:hypothetical protein